MGSGKIRNCGFPLSSPRLSWHDPKVTEREIVAEVLKPCCSSGSGKTWTNRKQSPPTKSSCGQQLLVPVSIKAYRLRRYTFKGGHCVPLGTCLLLGKKHVCSPGTNEIWPRYTERALSFRVSPEQTQALLRQYPRLRKRGSYTLRPLHGHWTENVQEGPFSNGRTLRSPQADQ